MSEFVVLLVEDNPGDARLIEEMFADADPGRLTDGSTAPPEVVVHHASTLDAGLSKLDDSVDVVLLDLTLPDSTGLDTLDAVHSTRETVPVVVLTGVPEERLGTDAVSRGAQDYLVKDEVTVGVLVRTIRYAVERKKTERALRRSTDQLAVLNRLTRHDIRNDITLVVGRANELRDHVDAEGEELLDEILTAGNHVLQLTRSIGDSVEMVSDDDVSLAPVSLRPLLESEAEKARELYGSAVISVGDVPDVAVEGNRLLSSVFGNLLSNAMLYNDQETPRVEVAVDVDAAWVTVRVSDNGPGIPAHLRDSIFESGERGERGSGLGTGLYIVDQLVDQYNGEVWVDDGEGGAVFTVSLRRAYTTDS